MLVLIFGNFKTNVAVYKLAFPFPTCPWRLHKNANFGRCFQKT